MDPAWVLSISFVLFLIMGVPVAISIGLSSLIGMMMAGLPFTYVAQTAFTAVNSFTVIAVPMFILSGALMEKGGLTDRLIDLSKQIVGGAPGGLATVTIVACTLFAAISGSGPATTAAIGAMLIPAMVRERYHKDFSSAVAACSGGIGVVIPPSIPMIIYGITAEVSITRLFVAGIIPGLFLGGFLFIAVFIISKKRGYASQTLDRNFKTVVRAFWEARWALLAPLIILGGIYGGVFTVTEASVVAVLYSLFVGFFIYRRLDLRSLFTSLVYAARVAGTVMLVLTTGRIFGRLLVIFQIPQQVSAALIELFPGPVMLIIMINLLLLFVGMWMETLTQIIILTPLLLPVAMNVGIHPIQFGIMFVIACEIGYETPPLGVNLFVASEISESSIEGISRESIPLIAAEIAVLFLVSFIPQLSLMLPNLLMR